MNEALLKDIEKKNKAIEQFNHRRGVVKISSESLNSLSEKELSKVFSVFFPIQIENKSWANFYDTRNYFGLSKHFREVSEDEVIPQYEMKMHREKNKISVTFEEVKP